MHQKRVLSGNVLTDFLSWFLIVIDVNAVELKLSYGQCAPSLRLSVESAFKAQCIQLPTIGTSYMQEAEEGRRSLAQASSKPKLDAARLFQLHRMPIHYRIVGLWKTKEISFVGFRIEVLQPIVISDQSRRMSPV